MEWITGLFDATLTGGLAGLVGTLFTGYMSYTEKKAERAHQVEMRKMDMEERKVEADLAIRHINTENEGKLALAEMGAFTTSFSMDRASYSLGTDSTLLMVVDAIRGLMRPLLTVMLVVITAWITFDIVSVMGGWEAVKGDYARSILDSMVNTVLFCTATSVTWWFGTRALNSNRLKG